MHHFTEMALDAAFAKLTENIGDVLGLDPRVDGHKLALVRAQIEAAARGGYVDPVPQPGKQA